jgi:methyl-accepting chemotaxis protein
VDHECRTWPHSLPDPARRWLLAREAGESGRGFAVVAGEVKGLASETARATENVNSQISAIRTETVAAVEALAMVAGIVRQVSETQRAVSDALANQRALADTVTNAR